jgi:hypothetical protein
MIQDKIFFDEKDPTGVSYNTPFTVYGSYQGRLWSKTPSGTIKYYTQNSDLSVYATTGSNQFSGSQTVTGSLTVTGGITGSVTTASYVEYTGVANKPTLVSGSEQVSFNGIVDKPTLVSGSAQVSFNGIVDKPTLVSGSSQITYSGISSIPAGIVSSSAQIGGYGIFATTGSNQFNGSQAVTGSLTVTGQVIAQTLNVQQVTSSIVYSSGSNVFGNSLSNTQQFTGSVSVTGSLAVNGTSVVTGTGTTNYMPKFTASTTVGSSQIFDNGTNVGINEATPSEGKLVVNNPNGSTNNGSTGNTLYLKAQTANANLIRFSGAIATDLIVGRFGNADAISIGTTGGTEIARFTSGGNVGIGTTSPTAKLQVVGEYIRLVNSADSQNILLHADTSRVAVSAPNGNLAFDTANAERMRITSGGNVGIGTTPSYRLHVVTDAVAGKQNMSNISRTTGNWVRFTNPQFSTDSSMGLILKSFPDSDGRQGAGIIASGGSNNASTDLDLFVTTSPDGLGGTSYSALNINGISGAATFSSSVTANYISSIISSSSNASPLILQNTSGWGSSQITSISVKDAIDVVGAIGWKYDGVANVDMLFHSLYNGAYKTVSNVVMTVKGTGNVGIGTTSPSSLLHLYSTSDSPQGITITGGDETFVKFLTTNVKNWGFIATNLAASDFGIYQSNSVGGDPFSAGTVRLYFNGDGNVGIGTTNPTFKLEVAGVVRIQDTLSFTNGDSGQAIFTNNSTAVSVSTTTALGGSFSMGGSGAFVIVYGSQSTNVFIDTIIAANTGTPTVLNSTTVSGSPSARTYSTASNRLQLAMASGTYDVRINILRIT